MSIKIPNTPLEVYNQVVKNTDAIAEVKSDVTTLKGKTTGISYDDGDTIIDGNLVVDDASKLIDENGNELIPSDVIHNFTATSSSTVRDLFIAAGLDPDNLPSFTSNGFIIYVYKNKWIVNYATYGSLSINVIFLKDTGSGSANYSVTLTTTISSLLNSTDYTDNSYYMIKGGTPTDTSRKRLKPVSTYKGMNGEPGWDYTICALFARKMEFTYNTKTYKYEWYSEAGGPVTASNLTSVYNFIVPTYTYVDSGVLYIVQLERSGSRLTGNFNITEVTLSDGTTNTFTVAAADVTFTTNTNHKME